jgi:hypothetical protein
MLIEVQMICSRCIRKKNMKLNLFYFLFARFFEFSIVNERMVWTQWTRLVPPNTEPTDMKESNPNSS